MPTIRGVILTGAGDKAFIAGADIGELAHATAIDAERSSRFGQAVLDLIENLGKPVVAAINGFALGGGCETAMACTIRIAADRAKFGQPEVKLGLLPGGGGTQRLPRLIGKGRALAAHSVRWDDQRAGGLPHRARQRSRPGRGPDPACGSDPQRDRLKRARSPSDIALEATNKGMDASQSEGFALEASYFGLCAATEDKREGTTAFLEKRAPLFQGR